MVRRECYVLSRDYYDYPLRNWVIIWTQSRWFLERGPLPSSFCESALDNFFESGEGVENNRSCPYWVNWFGISLVQGQLLNNRVWHQASFWASVLPLLGESNITSSLSRRTPRATWMNELFCRIAKFIQRLDPASLRQVNGLFCENVSTTTQRKCKFNNCLKIWPFTVLVMETTPSGTRGKRRKILDRILDSSLTANS